MIKNQLQVGDLSQKYLSWTIKAASFRFFSLVGKRLFQVQGAFDE
jgi:Na+-driven multidrug efflux pump